MIVKFTIQEKWASLNQKKYSKILSKIFFRIKADPEIIGVLQEFLQQLSSIPNLSNKIEPGECQILNLEIFTQICLIIKIK
jgi:hypothetical protein